MSAAPPTVPPHIHFDPMEFANRRARACAAMQARGLDGLILFKQESMYWLTGYDTFGYVYFQPLVLRADGRAVLLTRSADERQAAFTSTIEDIRVWVDREGSAPEGDLVAILRELGLEGKRLGVEWHAYGLTASVGFRVRDAIGGIATLSDASDVVSRLRMVKSEAELAHIRRAGLLADEAYLEACNLAGPGAFEGDIIAAMQGAIYKGGGDDPANETIIGSGTGALMCRYFTGRRNLDSDDQLTLEYAGVYRHYHACLMRTIRIGEPPPRQRDMHEACVASLEAAKAALKPGAPLGDVFDAHARVLDEAGLEAARLNACGYSLGATFSPTWMDWPERSMFFHGNTTLAEPGMVFFIHIIAFDSDSGLAMSSGQTVLVRADDVQPITRAPLELVVK